MNKDIVEGNMRDTLVITVLPAHFGGGGLIHNIEILKELNKSLEIEIVPSVTWNLVDAMRDEGYKEKLLEIINKHGLKLAEPVHSLLSRNYRVLHRLTYGFTLARELVKLFQGKVYKVVYSQSEFVVDLYLAAKIKGLSRGFLTQGLWFTRNFVADMELELATEYYKPWSLDFWKRLIYRSIFRNFTYHMIKRNKFNFILTVNPRLVDWSGLNRFSNVKIEILNPGNAYPVHSLSRPREQKEQYFVYYGRLTPTKGLFLIPRIVKEIAKECDDFKLYIFGSFPDESVKRKFFKNLNLLRIEDNIVYLGFLSEDEKLKVIAKAKAFLFPTLVDTYSLSILESLTLTTAVITTKLPTLEWLYSGLAAVKLCSDLRCFVENAINILRMNENEYYAMFDHKLKEFLELHSDWKKVAESEINALLKFYPSNVK